MAIDDSTSYELTGAQVKDLANKIKGKAADNIFVGATSSAPGSKGLVPQPQAGDDAKFLSGDGTWKAVGSGANSVTYYLQKQSTAGMSGIRTYIYTDSGRTTPAAPATLVANFVAGKTILLEYEQTGATEPYGITFHVNSASANGDPTVECQYKLLISELNNYEGNYNAVTTQLSATVTAGTTFSGRWGVVRAAIPDVPYSDYSTSEMPTGTTWIDGKPIYKKTYSMGALINGGGTLIQNISSLDFETVVELRGIAVNPSNHNARPLPLVSNGLSDMVRLDVSNNEIHAITTSGSSWSTTYNAYVTIWYTKTTD